MTQQIINVGPAPNDGLGDPIRTAFIKSNDNFSQLYSRAQTVPPTTLVGAVGDQAGMYAYDSTYFYYCFQDYDGSSIIWAQLTQAGNVAGTGIVNGTSNIQLQPSGNAQVSIGGTTNIAVFSTGGADITGYVSATGNVVSTANIAGSYILGNGSQLTGLPATYGNSNVAAYLPVFTGNIGGGNVNISSNVNAGNIISQGIISATANIVTAGYFVGTFVGNVTGNFVVPGSNTQVLFNTSGNADAVGGFTYDKDANTMTVLGIVSAQGNVLGGNVVAGNALSALGNVVTTANVSAGNVLVTVKVQATTLSASGNVVGGNVTVASGIVSASGNVTGGNINTVGNVTGGNILFGTGIVSGTGNVDGGNVNVTQLVRGATVSATSNVIGGNVVTSGIVSASGNVLGGNLIAGTLLNATSVTGTTISMSGNITGDYFFGNGSQLSGINVNTNKIVNGTSEANIGTVSGNANITIGGTANVGVFATTGLYVTGLISANGNISGGNVNGGSNVNATSLTGTTVSVSANITGGNVLFGAGIVSGTGNVTGGNVLFGSGQITGTGNITGGNVLFGSGIVSGTGNVIGGNLTTSGILTVNSGGAATAIVNGGSNAVGNIGSASTYFNRLFAQATTALYADLAEMYLADKQISSGTVVSFGGTKEITTCNQDMDARVAGVVSHKPAYQMNSGLEGDYVIPVALQGRVPCHVIGNVRKGDMMVSAGNGQARAEYDPRMGTVIGKALEDFDGGVGTIEIVVGRL